MQAEVEKALSFVANHPLDVVCAGRTDSGVHARCQVAHFDTGARRPASAWVRGKGWGRGERPSQPSSASVVAALRPTVTTTPSNR